MESGAGVLGKAFRERREQDASGAGSGSDPQDFSAGIRCDGGAGFGGEQGSGHGAESRAWRDKEEAAAGAVDLDLADIDRFAGAFLVEPQLERAVRLERGKFAGDEKKARVVFPEDTGGGVGTVGRLEVELR